MAERDLDFYVSTIDEHFNQNAQHFYFQFTGNKKPETDKPFEDFIDAIFEAYFFAINNPSKPFGCIAKVKELANLKGFNDADLLIFVDLLLGVISNMPGMDQFTKVFIQLVDFRHELSPYDKDQEIMQYMNEVFYFDIDKIKETLKNTTKPSDKLVFLSNLVFDFNSRKFEMKDGELDYYESIGLLHFIKVEIDRAEFEAKINIPVKSDKSEIVKNEYYLASKHKTDFIKILSSMYDAHLFVDAEGNPATNKQKLMEAFGQFLNDDFSAYSASLSQGKTRDEKTFLKPFKEIEKEALKYFDAVAE